MTRAEMFPNLNITEIMRGNNTDNIPKNFHDAKLYINKRIKKELRDADIPNEHWSSLEPHNTKEYIENKEVPQLFIGYINSWKFHRYCRDDLEKIPIWCAHTVGLELPFVKLKKRIPGDMIIYPCSPTGTKHIHILTRTGLKEIAEVLKKEGETK